MNVDNTYFYKLVQILALPQLECNILDDVCFAYSTTTRLRDIFYVLFGNKNVHVKI